MYVNPDTTDNTDIKQVQPAGYNAVHACRLPAEQEANTTRVR